MDELVQQASPTMFGLEMFQTLAPVNVGNTPDCGSIGWPAQLSYTGTICCAVNPGYNSFKA